MNNNVKIIKKENFIQLIYNEIASVNIENGIEKIQLKSPSNLIHAICNKLNLTEKNHFYIIQFFV